MRPLTRPSATLSPLRGERANRTPNFASGERVHGTPHHASRERADAGATRGGVGTPNYASGERADAGATRGGVGTPNYASGERVEAGEKRGDVAPRPACGERVREAGVRGFLAITLLVAPALLGQTVVGGTWVAQRGSLQRFDRSGTNVTWSTAGVQTPTAIVTSNDRVAVIDALANEVRIADWRTKQAATLTTGETPVDGIFINSALYLLERDARALERIGMDGARASINVAADPAFVRQVNGMLYVYSRRDGVLQEITTAPFAIRRSVRVAPFASDMEVDSRSAYLVDPRGANIGVVTLATMKTSGKIDAGAVPIDLALASTGSALTATTLAIADPSGKRVWLIEGSQSISQAVARGFLRGLLGLGLFGGNGSQFPTGVDRVIVRGSRWYAYDSSSGTLYRFTKKKSTVVAKNVAPAAFSVENDGIFIWNEAVRRLQRIDP